MSHYVLSPEELDDIQNAYSYISSFKQVIEPVLSKEAMKQLDKGFSLLQRGLAGYHKHDQDDFDKKYKYYERIGSKHKLENSAWSIFEVENLDSKSGLSGQFLIYKDHWGPDTDAPVSIPLPTGNLTWLTLWMAADAAIKESGDTHHMFIEGFHEKDGNIYLTTGS